MHNDHTIAREKSTGWVNAAVAKHYAGTTATSTPSNLQVLTYVRWIQENHRRTTSRCLDAACGTGALTVPLAKAGYRVTGIDISAAMLSQIPYHRNITTHIGDLLAPRLGLSETKPSFDVIVSRWALPHFPNWASILRTLGTLLAPGGSLYVDFPNPQHYQLARTLNGNHEGIHGYSFDEDASSDVYYCAPSIEEIKAAAARFGGVVVETRPASFLIPSAMVTDYSAYAGAITKEYKSRWSRRAIERLDQILTQSLPNALHPLLIYRITVP